MSRLQTFFAIFAVIAAAIFVNLLVSTISPRVDLTEDRTFTLSEGSLKIINKIEEPITLELYASRSDVKLRPYLESYSRRIEVLLREYVAASKGKIKLVLTDPKPDTKEEQRAQRYALTGMGALNGTAYLGLTIQQADTIKVINVFDPSREKFLEYD
ncbi:MAG: GldG family protein, partial [Opitutae bacterium]